MLLTEVNNHIKHKHQGFPTVHMTNEWMFTHYTVLAQVFKTEKATIGLLL